MLFLERLITRFGWWCNISTLLKVKKNALPWKKMYLLYLPLVASLIVYMYTIHVTSISVDIRLVVDHMRNHIRPETRRIADINNT